MKNARLETKVVDHANLSATGGGFHHHWRRFRGYAWVRPPVAIVPQTTIATVGTVGYPYVTTIV